MEQDIFNIPKPKQPTTTCVRPVIQQPAEQSPRVIISATEISRTGSRGLAAHATSLRYPLLMVDGQEEPPATPNGPHNRAVQSAMLYIPYVLAD